MYKKDIIRRLITEERDPFGKLISCTARVYDYRNVIENLHTGETEELVKEMHKEGLVLVEFSEEVPISIKVTPEGTRYLYQNE